MKHGDTNTRHDGEEPSAPPGLAGALKELPSRRVFVPPSIDDAVLGAARRHLAGPARTDSWNPFRSWLAWTATAAACLALLGLICVLTRPDRTASEIAREDINHDGQVDILDAFQLARELSAGESHAAGRDLNGDGVVDRRDAEVIAARAVKLEKGGRS